MLIPLLETVGILSTVCIVASLIGTFVFIVWRLLQRQSALQNSREQERLAETLIADSTFRTIAFPFFLAWDIFLLIQYTPYRMRRKFRFLRRKRWRRKHGAPR